MKTQPFIVAPTTRRSALSAIGMKITVLASSAETDAHEITLQQGDTGMGPPPHRHNWHESFYILSGEVEITCAGQSSVCGPGTLVHVPAGTVHGFRCLSDGCQMLEIAGQGSHAVRLFHAIDSEIPPGPPDIPTLVTVLGQHGVTVCR